MKNFINVFYIFIITVACLGGIGYGIIAKQIVIPAFLLITYVALIGDFLGKWNLPKWKEVNDKVAKKK